MLRKNPHSLPDNTTLSDVIENEYATVYFYGNITVVEVNEGVTISFKTGISLLLKSLTLLGTKPFIIISNRINSYSVNPTDYKYLERVPSLRGIAIVYHTESSKKAATLEAAFFNKPFELFDNIIDAYTWGEKLLN